MTNLVITILQTNRSHQTKYLEYLTKIQDPRTCTCSERLLVCDENKKDLFKGFRKYKLAFNIISSLNPPKESWYTLLSSLEIMVTSNSNTYKQAKSTNWIIPPCNKRITGC